MAKSCGVDKTKTNFLRGSSGIAAFSEAGSVHSCRKNGRPGSRRTPCRLTRARRPSSLAGPESCAKCSHHVPPPDSTMARQYDRSHESSLQHAQHGESSDDVQGFPVLELHQERTPGVYGWSIALMFQPFDPGIGQRPCECDLMLSCSKFLTTAEYAPKLRARLEREEELIADARLRGWPREAERHEGTQRRIRQLLDDLEMKPGTSVNGTANLRSGRGI